MESVIASALQDKGIQNCFQIDITIILNPFIIASLTISLYICRLWGSMYKNILFYRLKVTQKGIEQLIPNAPILLVAKLNVLCI